MQNTKRYWLRGGLAFAILSLVVGFLLMMGGEGSRLMIVLTHGIAMLPIALPLVGIFNFQTSNEDLYAVLFGTITYFVVGVLFGYIYGKIKNRNRGL